MSKKIKINCYGNPVTLEVTDDGDVIFHDWEQDAELVCIELGFEPSPCFIVWKAVNDGKLDKALIEQSEIGDADAVRALLFAGADVRAADDRALRWAAENGHADVVKILLNARADVRAINDYALRTASFEGRTDVVKILLKAGADVHAVNDQALKWAAENGHADVVKILEDWIKEHG